MRACTRATSTIEAEARGHGVPALRLKIDTEKAGEVSRFWFERHEGLS